MAETIAISTIAGHIRGEITKKDSVVRATMSTVFFDESAGEGECADLVRVFATGALVKDAGILEVVTDSPQVAGILGEVCGADYLITREEDPSANATNLNFDPALRILEANKEANPPALLRIGVDLGLVAVQQAIQTQNNAS